MQVGRELLYCVFALFGAVCALPALGQSKTHLEVGEVLRINQYLVAPDRKSFALLQTDGNLCVYAGDEPKNKGNQLWCSGSVRGNGSYFAQLRPDANLCIYRGAVPPADGREGSSIWCWGDKSYVGGRYVLRIEGPALIAYEYLAFPGNTAPRPPRQLWATRKAAVAGGVTPRENLFARKM